MKGAGQAEAIRAPNDNISLAKKTTGGGKEEPANAAKKKSWFTSITESISNAASSITKAASSATSFVGAISNVFKSKESEAARQQREAREAADAEANRKAREEAARKKAAEDRERREKEELLRQEEITDRLILGDPKKWRERYRDEERAKRLTFDPASLTWDATTLLPSATSDMSLQPPTSKLRVFCSSTFTDTHKERNILLGPLYKKIRRVAEKRGIDFSFIDMRYGVRDENTLDHKTWEACKEELVRCKTESAGLFFLSLQGHKYGYQSLPKYIPRLAFDEKMAQAPAEAVRHAKEWYLLDENALPNGRYSLKNLERKQLKQTALMDGLNLATELDNSYWDMMGVLRLALDGVPFDPEISPLLTIGQSVTEWEFISGSLDDDDCKRAFWLYRDFTDAVWPEDYNNEKDKFAYWDYQDSHIRHSNEVKVKSEKKEDPRSAFNIERDFLRRKDERLSELKVSMMTKLGKYDKMHRFRPLAFKSVKEQDRMFQGYLHRFSQKTEELLLDNINDTSAILNHWKFDGCGLGIAGKTLSEFCHHISWAKAKISTFEGREGLISACLEKLLKKNRVEPLPRGEAPPKISLKTRFKESRLPFTVLAAVARRLWFRVLHRPSSNPMKKKKCSACTCCVFVAPLQLPRMVSAWYSLSVVRS